MSTHTADLSEYTQEITVRTTHVHLTRNLIGKFPSISTYFMIEMDFARRSASGWWERRVSALILLVLLVVAVCGCSDDNPSQPGGNLPIDTSSLAITDLHHTGYDADDEVETGLALQWTLAFESTTARDCRIRMYRLFDRDSVEIYRRETPTLQYIHNGGELRDKEIWIPVSGSTSSGDYVFVVNYETGYLLDKGGGQLTWNGPLSTGSESRDFTVVPK
ncbi:MAG: hypothetical protein Kow0074_12890 [Candidatus Zixiibacteriota bacterium]